MKIHKVLTLAIIANISIIGGAVSIGEARADDGETQSVFIEIDLGPQDNALVLEISGEELDAFEVSCHDDGQLPDRVRNDTIQTCQGEVPSEVDLNLSLRVGGGEMTAVVEASGVESSGGQRYLLWNDSGLQQVAVPDDISPPSQGGVEAPLLEVQPQSPASSSPLLPFVFGAVAGLGLAVMVRNISSRDGILAQSNLIGLPPDIEECLSGVDVEATINEMLEKGPLVIAHPESFVVRPKDRANIISVTERDVVDVIDVLSKLARDLPTQRIGLIVLGELESVGDPGLSFVERLSVEAPLGSIIRVLK